MAARRSVYWFGIDEDLQMFVENCLTCKVVNFHSIPDQVPWPSARYPFERVPVDFCQLQRVHYIVLVDAFSKWIHACIMSSTTAGAVTAELLLVFAVWGLPHLVVTDNGPPFDSQDFRDFYTGYGIALIHTPPYHPESNGPGERAVQLVKKAFRKMFPAPELESAADASLMVSQFLFAYRNTPSTATSKSPNELLLTFTPRTLLSQLNPHLNPRNAPLESQDLFRENDVVLLRCGRQPVVSGRVIRRLSATRYLVSVSGVLKKPHINQMVLAPPVQTSGTA